MPTSFYIFLVASFIALIPAWFDHGETWREIKLGTENEKCQNIIKLLTLWTIPILTILGTVFLGIETIKSDIQDKNREKQYAGVTNALAEASARLTSLSHDVALSSPTNFPISSVSGSGLIDINKSDMPLVIGLKNEQVWLDLMPEPPPNSVIRNPMLLGDVLVIGVIRGAWTNQSGGEMAFDFDQSNLHQTGGGPAVTFNSVGYARLNIPLNGHPASILRVEKGFLELNLNSPFNFFVAFKFPPQTNEATQIWAIRKKGQF